MTLIKFFTLCGVCVMLAAGQIFLKLTAREISFAAGRLPVEILLSRNFWLAIVLYGA
jgi:hypothetical protein